MADGVWLNFSAEVGKFAGNVYAENLCLTPSVALRPSKFVNGYFVSFAVCFLVTVYESRTGLRLHLVNGYAAGALTSRRGTTGAETRD